MGSLLTSTELKRVFTFKKKGKVIDLPDFNPNLGPEEILKYYSGNYPELTNAKVEAPKYEGANMIFNIETEVGTKG